MQASWGFPPRKVNPAMSRLLVLHAAAGLLAAAAFSPAAAAGAPPSPPQVVESLMTAYVSAWNHADPHALAGAFAADGDFVNPTGYLAKGPAQIEGFYREAFARGYAGSHAQFTTRLVRRLAPGVIAVDGEWSITGAHDAAGHAAPTEAGIATAVLVAGADGWRVTLLREQSSAEHLHD